MKIEREKKFKKLFEFMKKCRENAKIFFDLFGRSKCTQTNTNKNVSNFTNGPTYLETIFYRCYFAYRRYG